MPSACNQLYAPTEENLIKANKSIRQALFKFFEYRNSFDDEQAAHWLKVYHQRIEFFCKKLGVSENVLAMYF